MSIPVEVGDLRRALADFGAGYLVTVSPAGTAKVVSVEPVAEGDVVTVSDVGKGSARNLADNPAVTLVFPPAEPRGFTLLVDGTGELDGDDLRVTATNAILHRPGRHADGPPPPASAGELGDACRNECAPVVSSTSSSA